MPELADRSPSSEDTVIYIKIPTELAKWLDLHLAEMRLALLRAGKHNIIAPTRSSFLRDLLFKARSNGHTK